MSSATASLAAPQGRAATYEDHSVPLFEGAQSRRHVRRSMRRFRLEAAWLALRHHRALADAQVLVQFTGWPRSGHSLVGALIDAHPGAAVSHELDAMGLVAKGLPARRVPALIAGSAAAFTRAGRWWNGYSYAVSGAPHGPSGPLRVVGDKKGDWAARWAAADATLVRRLAEESRLDCRWILVTRNPMDNIATMSLRRGGAYDRLRIGSDSFADALRKAQSQGDVAGEADDEMIADYAALAASVAAMKSAVPEDKWLEITYEDFARAPREGLERIAAFLDLPADTAWLDGATALVRAGKSRSRDSIAWRDKQRTRVAALVEAHDFLTVYADDL